MPDNTVLDSGSGGDTIATASLSFSGDTAKVQVISAGLLSGSEGSWSFSLLVGGAGVVTAGTPRVTLASDDPAVTLLGTINGKIPSLGQALAAGSVPVVLPTAQITALTPPAAITGFLTEADFDTKAGSLTETAPATDTASSGLNGRLQRIAQRITSLIALIPAALTGNGNFKVSLQESNATQAVSDGGGSITVDGSVSVSGVVPGTSATSLGKAEDAVAADGDTGVMTLAVRKDTAATTVGADGDYHPLEVDGNGRLWVNGSSVTQPVSAASLPLPSGAATESTLSTLNGKVTACNTGAVTISAALPAGTNAIGKLAANSGVDIGDVDVTSVPTDPFGANADAASATGSISAKLRFIASTGIPITGTVAATQSGTWTEANSAAIAASLSVMDDWDESDRAKVNPIVGQAGVAAGNGAVTAATQRVALADISAGDYETVAASQTDQAFGATGATGDYLAGVLIVPATTSPGAVSIKDGSGSAITIFTGGASSVSNLVPFFVPLGIVSGSGAWKVTTGTNVSAIGVGNFT
jgi:hypothetical protein